MTNENGEGSTEITFGTGSITGFPKWVQQWRWLSHNAPVKPSPFHPPLFLGPPHLCKRNVTSARSCPRTALPASCFSRPGAGDFYEDRFCIAESLCSQAGCAQGILQLELPGLPSESEYADSQLCKPSLILCSGLRIVSDVKENPEFSTEVRFIGSVEQSARVLGLAHCCECSNASAHPKHLSHVVLQCPKSKLRPPLLPPPPSMASWASASRLQPDWWDMARQIYTFTGSVNGAELQHFGRHVSAKLPGSVSSFALHRV